MTSTGTFTTNGPSAYITLASIKAGISRLLEAPFHALAERYGFDLRKGDRLLFPAGKCPVAIPEGLRDAVMEHPFVEQALFIKADCFGLQP